MDELLELIDDAIEDAMAQHEPQYNDSVCSCGAVNNMDGDVLHSHRVGVVSDAVRGILERHLIEEQRTLPDGMGGISTNWKTGETTHYSRPCTQQSRWATPWLTVTSPEPRVSGFERLRVEIGEQQ